MPRSRNAVVALKLGQLGLHRPALATKQERRGGIETWDADPRGSEAAAGSRNAVVALKLLERLRSIAGRAGSRNAVVALKPSMTRFSPLRHRSKQERRGGIETRLQPGGQGEHVDEAGTPWWH